MKGEFIEMKTQLCRQDTNKNFDLTLTSGLSLTNDNIIIIVMDTDPHKQMMIRCVDASSMFTSIWTK